MICYLRHMERVILEAGIEVTPANRRKVDALFKGLSGQKNCSLTWKQLKQAIAEPHSRQALVASVRDRWQAAGLDG